jgi:hypothetical protein
MAVLGTGIDGVLWPDAEVEGLDVGYDTVVLSVRETTKRQIELRCWGHIGLSIEGFWDEIVVESADLVAAHPFMDRCLASLAERLGDQLPPSGSPARDTHEFATLVLTLGDGCRILCVAATFEVTALDP